MMATMIGKTQKTQVKKLIGKLKLDKYYGNYS